MLENSSGVQYIERPIGDSKQHFYVGGKVQFADDSGPAWETLDVWEITALVSDTEIEVVMPGATPQTVDLDSTPVRVFEIPDEVRSDSENTQDVAPYRIQDDFDYADEEYFWSRWSATQAAEKFTNYYECDCRIENAYHNDVEYFEYEEPEDEEDEEEND